MCQDYIHHFSVALQVQDPVPPIIPSACAAAASRSLSWTPLLASHNVEGVDGNADIKAEIQGPVRCLLILGSGYGWGYGILSHLQLVVRGSRYLKS